MNKLLEPQAQSRWHRALWRRWILQIKVSKPRAWRPLVAVTVVDKRLAVQRPVEIVQ